MGEIKLTATARISITARAEDADDARDVVMRNLHDADTEFVRGDYFEAELLVAEIHIEGITND